jgi:hypothetical protein
MKITKSKEWYYWAYIATMGAAWIFCVVPTVIAGMLKLPLFATKDASTTLTGSFTLVLVCAAYPLLKGLLKLLKSPSAWFILWLLFGVTFLLYNIERSTLGAMVLVLFVAAMGNTIGAVLFSLSKSFKEKWMFLGDPKNGGSV